MKKVLFASTALVMTAGFAAADVTAGGGASFGLYHDGTTTIVRNSIDFNLTGTGESDGGVAFGASLDIETGMTDEAVDSDIAGTSGELIDDPEAWIEVGGLKLSVGAVDAASDIGGISDVGYDGLNIDDAVDDVTGNSGTDVRIDYSFGDIAVAASIGSASDDWALGASGSFGDVTFALGFGEAGGVDETTVTLGYATGAFSVAATYGEAGAVDAFGISGTYTQGDLSVTATYAERSGGYGDAYGIGASYSLGGGLSVAGGFGEDRGTTVADFGVNMSF